VVTIQIDSVWDDATTKGMLGPRVQVESVGPDDTVTMGVLPRIDPMLDMHVRSYQTDFLAKYKPAINPRPCPDQVWRTYDLIPKWGLHKVKITKRHDTKAAWSWVPLFEKPEDNKLGIKSGFILDEFFPMTHMMRFLSGPLKFDKSRFPHTCTRCGSPAYLGGGPSNVDCSSALCPTKGLTIRI